MNYDEKDIKKKTIVIDGKPVEIKVVPAGMHGKEWKPNPYDSSFTEDEDQEIQMIKKDLVDAGVNETTDEGEEPVIGDFEAKE